MIIDYQKQYDEEIKDLLVELQEYIVSIDKEKYNIITSEYREKYFLKMIEEVNKYNGKIFLYKEDDVILGLIVGIINNDAVNDYDFKAPKRGRVTELIVTKKKRSCGVGKKLLEKMTTYFENENCEDILIEVFAYNLNAIDFYEKNNYHSRLIEMTRKIKEN